MKNKVMIVDDEAVILNLAKMILEKEKYEVILASTGDEALQKAELEFPDLIILDMMMPGKSGLEVCKILKKRIKTRFIPVVMFTVLNRAIDRKHAEESGANGYIVKPFMPSDLIREVKQQLKTIKLKSAKQQILDNRNLKNVQYKIAMLSWESLYTIHIGGMAVAATRLAEALSEAGHRVHFFTRRAPGQPQFMTINGVHYYTCVFEPGKNSLEFAYKMSKSMVAGIHEVERYEGKFDIIHGHDWLITEALHDLKQEGYHVVLTYHSTEFGRNGGTFGDWWEFKEISSKEWYGGYVADRITTVSHHMKNELHSLYNIPIEKIEVIPNAIDATNYRLNVDAGRIKEKYSIHPLAPTVGFIGRLEYQKGPDLLLEAIPKILENRWDTKFFFIGQGSMKNYLESKSRELGVEQATRILNFVPYWHFRELLNACDIICLPSRNEPFGIALLEAWSAGKPVVATDVGGLSENIDNFVNGIKVYVNPDSIAWGINYLLNSPDMMKKISDDLSGKLSAYRWETAIDKLVDTYAIALNHHMRFN